MSKEENPGKPISGPKEALAEVDSSLGQVLVVLQRLVPRLDDPERAADVQAALGTASGCLEAARKAYEKFIAQARTTVLSTTGHPKVDSEIVAVIAAAVSAERAGAKVAVATKGSLQSCNSAKAQGGIQASFGEDDSPEQLIGRQVAAVVNFPPRQIAKTISEVLTLGFPDAAGEVVLIIPERRVPNGGRLF